MWREWPELGSSSVNFEAMESTKSPTSEVKPEFEIRSRRSAIMSVKSKVRRRASRGGSEAVRTRCWNGENRVRARKCRVEFKVEGVKHFSALSSTQMSRIE